jgi:3-hydroxyisobutyrate dehydrogenase-like beta-hydroxyacid dehydrogenase
MTEVTVIGLGEMGTALAGALVRAGWGVTVWNRTGAKAGELVRSGATLAPDAAAALRASPVVIVCVSDYAASRSILADRETASALAGRVLVQLSTGTPGEARETEAWARAQGADYVDGAILAWPRQIGGAETVILFSGAEAVFRRIEPLLRTLAGGASYMGEAAGLASALFSAVLAYLAGRWIGFCHGALICEAEGLGVASFGSLLADLAPILGADDKHMGAVIENGDFADPESALKTAGEDIGRLVRQAEEAGINPEVPRFAAALFRRAIEAGCGAEEHAALVKVLRRAA